MKRNSLILIIPIIFVLFLSVFALKDNQKKYTIEELKNLPQKELYEVFIDNGLNLDEELKTYLTDEQIGEMLKEEFDLLVSGNTSRSHSMYLRFAKEVKRVYELIAKTSG